MAEEKDQVVEENREVQSENEQSGDTEKEPLTIEQIASLAQGLQKGYTITRQEMAEMRDSLKQIAESQTKQAGHSEQEEEEYLTVGKLRKILSEQSSQKADSQKKSLQIVNSFLSDLRVKGVINSDTEEEEFAAFTVKKFGKNPDLELAAEMWQELKKAKADSKKEAAKTKAQQEEGSKIGTSSKTSVTEQGGIDYAKVRDMDWYSF